MLPLNEKTKAIAKPFVSVIIPVYNGETFLAEAVESIQRQGYPPLEIIIVDDGSTDSTANVVASLQADVRYVYQTNSGPAAARNRGLGMAQGDVIGFLDADDLWPDNKLAVQLACLAAQPRTEIVLGYVQWMRLAADAGDNPRFESFAEPFVSFNLGSALFRKSVFDKVGLYDPTLRYSEDVDWFMRAREQGVSMVILEQTTLLYRLHQLSITHGKSANALNILKVIKRSLDRRRQNDGFARSLPRIPNLSQSMVHSHNQTDLKEGD